MPSRMLMAGRCTTLGLTATSCHPENAGVQIPLMELLIAHGAIIDGPDGYSGVNGCLHNGRGEAAEFLANRGARLDLEGAAGVGRLDVVKGFFTEDGSLKPPATPEQMQDGFAWACEFGRISVVEFLLQKGIQVDAKLRHGADRAALGRLRRALRHRPTAARTRRSCRQQRRQLRRNALGMGAIWLGAGPRPAGRGSYYEAVALLVRAGARLDPGWYEDDEDRRQARDKVQSDSRMTAALRGEF